jgi:hypothetical protein
LKFILGLLFRRGRGSLGLQSLFGGALQPTGFCLKTTALHAPNMRAGVLHVRAAMGIGMSS